MTVMDVQKNPEALTLTLTARFDAPPVRVWQVWQDPRQLERWWGPPTYPATVVDHDLAPGGRVAYFMTGPEGDKHHGWWRILSVDAPHRLEFEDGFSDDAGRPNPEMPTTTVRVRLTSADGTSTVMTVESTFATPEAMKQLLSMGMDEGMTASMNQIDTVLAGPAVG
ncbi:SRPBCC domain-containing protein [Streptomyces sp. GESEQ-35]|uniref:SRPBCC family protein n=1 Tax=Streptomyces sp. GESEQ-35 TaxID=2812657 RepID=UPI001B3430AE|nr:SRPBCC domain-containing protein [Streptomyces sp. GESEQ-35]